MSERSTARPWIWPVLATLIFVAAALTLGLNFTAGKLFACGPAETYCPASTEKNGVWTGILLERVGNRYQPYRSKNFAVDFSTVSNVSFRTDQAGQFCIQWPAEEVVPSAKTPSGGGLVEQGARLPGDGWAPGIRHWTALEGRRPPAGCEQGDATIAWYRANHADTRWQYWLLNLLPAAALVILGVVALSKGRWRLYGLMLAGGLVAAEIIAGAVLWNV